MAEQSEASITGQGMDEEEAACVLETELRRILLEGRWADKQGIGIMIPDNNNANTTVVSPSEYGLSSVQRQI